MATVMLSGQRYMRTDGTTKKTRLSVQNVDLSFGGLKALSDVSFDVREGEIFAIIGPNGAGKTSILNCISGFYHPSRGRIFFEDQDISKHAPHRRAQLGISRTFQNIELYAGMTTLENLMAARHIYFKRGFLWEALRFGPALREEIIHREIVEKIISFLGITAIRNKKVANLPFGLRRMVELGRALALEPKLLLLDEPLSGMNLEEKMVMCRIILDILDLQAVPIVLVEHDMGAVMDIADRIAVFDFGRQIATGTPDEIKVNPTVIKAYLGKVEETTPL